MNMPPTMDRSMIHTFAMLKRALIKVMINYEKVFKLYKHQKFAHRLAEDSSTKMFCYGAIPLL